MLVTGARLCRPVHPAGIFEDVAFSSPTPMHGAPPSYAGKCRNEHVYSYLGQAFPGPRKPGLDGASCDGGARLICYCSDSLKFVLILPLRQALLPYIRLKLRETRLVGWLVVSGKYAH